MLVQLLNLISEENVSIEFNIENGFYQPSELKNLNISEENFAPYYSKQDNILYFSSTIKGLSRYYSVRVDESFFPNLETTYTPLPVPPPLNENNKSRAYLTETKYNNRTIVYLNVSVNYPSGNYVNIQKCYKETSGSGEKQQYFSSPMIDENFAGEFFTGYPTISPSGKTMVYSSNKESKDHIDLWIALLGDNGDWIFHRPMHELNSKGNEITPYLINDSLLIYSSNGFGGRGGYDLFYSYCINGK